MAGRFPARAAASLRLAQKLAALACSSGLVHCGIWPSFSDDLLDVPVMRLDAAVPDAPRLDREGFMTCAPPTGSADPLVVFAQSDADTGMPVDLAFDGRGGLYVASAQGISLYRSDGHVTAMFNSDLVTGVQTVRFAPSPASLVVGTTRTMAGVAPMGSVTELQPINASLVAVLATGLMSPAGLAVDASGTVYASDGAAGTILRITPDGAATVLTLAVDTPAGLALSLDGRHLYVGSTTADRGIRRLDLAADGSLVAAPVPYATTEGPSVGLAFDQCGNLYVADPVAGRVLRIGFGGSPVDSIAVAPAGMPFHPRGLAFGAGTGFPDTDLFVADESGRIGVLAVGTQGLSLPRPP